MKIRAEICSCSYQKNNTTEMSSYRIILIILLTILNISLSNNVLAIGRKDPKLQKLESEYNNATNDKDKVAAGIKLSKYCLNINNNKCPSYAEAAAKIAQKNKLKSSQADLLNIAGTYYFTNKNYRKAATAFENEYEIRKKLQQARPRAATCYNLGFCYFKLKNLKKAKKYYDESYNLAKKLGDKELNDRLTRAYCDISLSEKDYKKAYDYLNTYLKAENKRFRDENARLMEINGQQEQQIEIQDSTIAVVTTKNEELTDMTLKLEMEKRELEMETKIKNQNLLIQNLENMKLAEEIRHNQEALRATYIIAGTIAIALLMLIFFLFKIKKMNKNLKENSEIISAQNIDIQNKNKMITKTMEELEIKNKDITDSITYAGKIQKALLHNFETYSRIMHDYFIFYAPKDIVSGDFYWAYKVDNKFVFTVGDCTGHSVPGAFMCMLGISMLNQIVGQQHEVQASQILEKMRTMLKSNLGQTGMNEEPKDGMDMALCVWDVNDNTCNFAGAYNPLVLVRNGEMKVFDAVKAPVGIHTREHPFKDETFQLQKGDRLYLSSDGYSDQFGETTHEKFKMARFRQLLVKTSNMPMSQQLETIQKAYYDWKGDFIQIDDVCVMGVEI